MSAALNNSGAVSPRRIAGSIGGGENPVPAAERGVGGPEGGEGGADGGASLSSAGSRVRCTPTVEGAFRWSTWAVRATTGTTPSLIGSVGALEAPATASGVTARPSTNFVRGRQTELPLASVEARHKHRVPANVVGVVRTIAMVLGSEMLRLRERRDESVSKVDQLFAVTVRERRLDVRTECAAFGVFGVVTFKPLFQLLLVEGTVVLVWEIVHPKA
eukprot:432875-Pleurochrysis_carterae.AAC.2